MSKPPLHAPATLTCRRRYDRVLPREQRAGTGAADGARRTRWIRRTRGCVPRRVRATARRYLRARGERARARTGWRAGRLAADRPAHTAPCPAAAARAGGTRDAGGLAGAARRRRHGAAAYVPTARRQWRGDGPIPDAGGPLAGAG